MAPFHFPTEVDESPELTDCAAIRHQANDLLYINTIFHAR